MATIDQARRLERLADGFQLCFPDSAPLWNEVAAWIAELTTREPRLGVSLVRRGDFGELDVALICPDEATCARVADQCGFTLPPPPPPVTPLTGGCLCAAVRFELDLPFLRAQHCHCSRCRRHSGATGLIQGRVPRERFRLLSGAEQLRVFRPDGGARKVFCSICGSSLFGGDWPDGPEVSIRFGALDGEPGLRPQAHTFVGSKACWERITDEKPQFEAGPGSIRLR